MEKLKPCPFCGNEARTNVECVQFGGERSVFATYVRCTKCGVYKKRLTDMKNISFEDFENVFAQTIFEWNNRV